MKAITFKVNRKGGYVATALVPANHSESAGVSKLGVGIAGTLLLLTAGFLVFMGILLTQ
ncbi:MAG TPA: hypothetical protein VN281_16865 [Verrucomicrobiae bacterium]|jgi:hypothetical protein|nr:hypothetical protein [Verrucomicrobiae bacterium]